MKRLGAVVILCVLLAGCGDGEKSATVDSYRVDAAGTTLTLDVVARPGSRARAEVVTQDSSSVVVRVRAKEPSGATPDLGEHHAVTVRLDDPLGSRTVRTEEGMIIPTAAPS